jgi:SiaC family regulatory phosphoprotein
MQRLFQEKTALTPEIQLSPEENSFYIRGISSPEDVRALYYPVIEWINAFCSETIEDNKLNFTTENPLVFKADLEYFNSSSAKFMYDIFLELKRLTASGIPVVVEWHYEESDIDLKEAGFDIATLAGMEFTYIPKK